MSDKRAAHKKKPEWLRIPVRGGGNLKEVKELLHRLHLNTVCVEANCPNRMECFSSKTATFMILGSTCSRDCRFCNVKTGKPEAVDPEEPQRLAEAVKKLGLEHVVVTSVTRDDLPDGGAAHFAKTITEVRKLPGVTIEVLIPDFQGSPEALHVVVEASPDIINHNIETVPSLYPEVRPGAVYERSLELLQRVKKWRPDIYSKSGLMLGLGERAEEVEAVMEDLCGVGCDFLTIGQYIAPSEKHLPVQEYIPPEQFEIYRKIAYRKGFSFVASAPFVRSSYKAAEAIARR